MWAGGSIPEDYGCCGVGGKQPYGWGSEALFRQTNEEVGKAAGGAASGVVTGFSLAAGMATTAGALATVPVAGWIAGAAVATAATAVALVAAIKMRKVKNAEAEKVAEALGFPTSARPNFIRRALRWDEFKIKRKLVSAKKRYLRFKQAGKLSGKRGKQAKGKYLLYRAILIVQEAARKDDLKAAIYAKSGSGYRQDALKRLSAQNVQTPAVQAPSELPVVPLVIGGVALVGILWLSMRKAT